jgi:hypothetical protein
MAADLECPYCNADLEVCHDDGFGYGAAVPHEMTCCKCDKSFVFFTSISFSYEAEKADCLNGSPHNYELTATYPPKWARMRCADCGHERQPTESENPTLAAARAAGE